MFIDVIICITLRLMLVINRPFMYFYVPLVALDLIQLKVFSIFITNV
jgi:hypothetical protein